MDKLFTSVKEGHDQKNRIVFVVETESGYQVTKPRTGFASKSWADQEDPELLACFERQCADSHNHASYLPAERDEVPGDQVPGDQVPGDQVPGNEVTGNEVTE